MKRAPRNALREATNEPGGQMSILGELIMNLAVVQQAHAGFVDKTSSKACAVPAELLSKRGDFEKWYCHRLRARTYTVQTIAVLHSRRIEEADHLREELYQPVCEEAESYQAKFEAQWYIQKAEEIVG
jgi:hypothetical protein